MKIDLDKGYPRPPMARTVLLGPPGETRALGIEVSPGGSLNTQFEAHGPHVYIMLSDGDGVAAITFAADNAPEFRLTFQALLAVRDAIGDALSALSVEWERHVDNVEAHNASIEAGSE